VSSDAGNIYELDPNGVQSTFVSQLNGPLGLAFDKAGNLFVADGGAGNASSGNIYKFTPNGARTIFASGLNNPDTERTLRFPRCCRDELPTTWPSTFCVPRSE
jgi:DNA-binding beta-propeller fold protein YncE